MDPGWLRPYATCSFMCCDSVSFPSRWHGSSGYVVRYGANHTAYHGQMHSCNEQNGQGAFHCSLRSLPLREKKKSKAMVSMHAHTRLLARAQFITDLSDNATVFQADVIFSRRVDFAARVPGI
jgi:hypothetical protein